MLFPFTIKKDTVTSTVTVFADPKRVFFPVSKLHFADPKSGFCGLHNTDFANHISDEGSIWTKGHILIEWKPFGERFFMIRIHCKYAKHTVIMCDAPMQDAEEAN